MKIELDKSTFESICTNSISLGIDATEWAAKEQSIEEAHDLLEECREHLSLLRRHSPDHPMLKHFSEQIAKIVADLSFADRGRRS